MVPLPPTDTEPADTRNLLLQAARSIKCSSGRHTYRSSWAGCCLTTSSFPQTSRILRDCSGACPMTRLSPVHCAGGNCCAVACCRQFPKLAMCMIDLLCAALSFYTACTCYRAPLQPFLVNAPRHSQTAVLCAAQDVVPLDIHHTIATRARLQRRGEGRAEPAVPGHTPAEHHAAACACPCLVVRVKQNTPLRGRPSSDAYQTPVRQSPPRVTIDALF